MNCGGLSPGFSFAIGMLVGGRSPSAGVVTGPVVVSASRPYGSDVDPPATVVVCRTVSGPPLPAVADWLP